MKKLFLTAVIGAVIIFAWNALSWLILPFHTNALHNLPESSLNLAAMRAGMPAPGVYHYPGLPETDSPEAWQALVEKSNQEPVISLMVYLPAGREIFSPVQFFTGLVFNLLASVIAVFLLAQTQLNSYGRRVLFVVLLGVFAGIVSYLADGNWYGFPLPYTLTMMGDVVIGWLLAGLFFAKVINPINPMKG